MKTTIRLRAGQVVTVTEGEVVLLVTDEEGRPLGQYTIDDPYQLSDVTQRAIRDSYTGEGVESFDSVEAMLAELVETRRFAAAEILGGGCMTPNRPR